MVHPSTKKIDKKPRVREASINTVQLISAHFTRDISETQIFTRSRGAPFHAFTRGGDFSCRGEL